MIDRFSRKEFEDFLEYLISGDLADRFAREVTVLPLGLRQGEYCYKIPMGRNAWLWFRSSIDESGFAAEAGQDSIRIWVGNFAGEGLMRKKQAYVTRQVGWRGRLEAQARLLLNEWQERGELITAMRSSSEKTMFAKYDGFCVVCKQKIHEGEPIAKREVPKKGEKWVHFRCPQKEAAAVTLIAKNAEDQPLPDADALDALAEFFSSAIVQDASWEHECPDNGYEMVLLRIGETCTCGATQEEEQRKSLERQQVVFSPYQLDIFDFIEHGEGNAVVEAVAGSGKTFTLVRGLNYIPKSAKAIYLAFNKHIVGALRQRQQAGEIPSEIQVKTVHALGLSNLVEYFQVADSHSFIEKRKMDILMDDRETFPTLDVRRSLPIEQRMQNMARRHLVAQIVSLCKNTMVDALRESMNFSALYDLVEHYGIDMADFGDEELELVYVLLHRCAEQVEVIDFDDMAWLPVQLGIPLEKFDFIMVDEAQDLNAVQIEFILRSLAPEGRVIAVGDRHQSLYGFRGADTEAIPRLIEMLHARVLPLSITYRCPRSHVELAQQLVPEIEARPNAPEGLVAFISEAQVVQLARPKDMIICRINGPLVPLAYQLIAKGIKATVRGREIGKGLIEMIERFEAKNLVELTVGLTEYLQRESLRLSTAEKWEQLQTLQDRVMTITAVMAECDTVASLVEHIDKLFSDEVEGVVCSSIHGAKGLEAKRVFLLRPDLLPHPYAKKGWQKVQELNAEYVAKTRSLNELLIVEA
jgi:DNA helicase-2/ATP-dependent DNA helicase PcrA